MDKRQDDYLVLKNYEGHSRNETYPDFSTFQHEEEFYFAMLDSSDHVLLRSEGYTTEIARNNGIESVGTNRKIEGRCSIEEYMNHFFVFLKAGNDQEIGRSGAYSTMAAAEAAMAAISVSHATSGASTLAGLKILSVTRKEIGETKNYGEPKLVKENRKDLGEKSRKVIGETRTVISETRNQLSETRNVVKKGIAMAAVTAMAGPTFFKAASSTFTPKALPVAGPIAVTAVEDPDAGFLGLLPWLLLFLIPLLFLKACPPPLVAGPVAALITIPPPPPPVVVAAPVCDCDAHKHRVFDLPEGPAPKVLKKLGTFPEFGDSHALDANGFYNKLKNRYATNEVDKKFLDEIFKEMGYDGFADAKANMFSEATLTSGVEGNIGGGPMHKTYYRKLSPTNPRDLLAFKINAKNGCHLHFMKTCGNHMFTKPCPAQREDAE